MSDYDDMLREQEDIRNDRFGDELQHASAEHGRPQPLNIASRFSMITTFGQVHVHRVQSVTIDKDSLVRITGTDYQSCRKMAFETFGEKFCFTHEECEFTSWDYFPRGIVLTLEAT